MYSCDLESAPGLPLAPSDITLMISRSTRTPLLINVPPLYVEENESIKDTVLREVLEETGADIIPIKIVGKYYHTSKNFNYDGITFDSNRVEYFYFCRFKGFKEKNLGIKGEFDAGDVQAVFLDYEDVMNAKLFKRDKSMIERAMNEYLLYNATKNQNKKF